MIVCVISLLFESIKRTRLHSNGLGDVPHDCGRHISTAELQSKRSVGNVGGGEWGRCDELRGRRKSPGFIYCTEFMPQIREGTPNCGNYLIPVARTSLLTSIYVATSQMFRTLLKQALLACWIFNNHRGICPFVNSLWLCSTHHVLKYSCLL